jgi:hypothetical protein
MSLMVNLVAHLVMVMNMLMIAMVMTVVITSADYLIDQIIAYRIERYDTLIAGTSFFDIAVAISAQRLDGRSMVSYFIFADNDGVCRTAGVSALHLRFEAAAGIGRSAM